MTNKWQPRIDDAKYKKDENYGDTSLRIIKEFAELAQEQERAVRQHLQRMALWMVFTGIMFLGLVWAIWWMLQ